MDELKSEKSKRNRNRILISLVSLLIGIFLWWLFTEGMGTVSPKVMPGPIRVFNSFIAKFTVSAPDGATCWFTSDPVWRLP